MRNLSDAIDEIAEAYVTECLAEHAEIDVQGRNNLNVVQIERLIALATQDDEIRALILSEIKERMTDTISELKMESFGERFEKLDCGFYPALGGAA
jgi:hypothetical protein